MYSSSDKRCQERMHHGGGCGCGGGIRDCSPVIQKATSPHVWSAGTAPRFLYVHHVCMALLGGRGGGSVGHCNYDSVACGIIEPGASQKACVFGITPGAVWRCLLLRTDAAGHGQPCGALKQQVGGREQEPTMGSLCAEQLWSREHTI
jgi:hypothetical protein